MPGPIADGEGKVLTLEDLIEAVDKRERTSSNVPKINTFHFNGERVSDWLDLVAQALMGLPDEVKFQRILKYVLHIHHQEVKKVIRAANGSWARFKDGMKRKYRLGDGLLTTTDLEAMNKDNFTTVGAFVQKFKKKARKVYGISEEAQCAIFLELLTAAEAAELTSYGGGSEKLTWATIDKGVAEGSLDEVEQYQMRLQRRKKKERDATASETLRVRRIVTDVLAELGYEKDVVIYKKVVTAVQGRGKDQVVEEAVREEWEEEEPVPQHLSKALRKQRNLAQGGQGSGKGKMPQTVVVTPPSVSAPSSSAGPSQVAMAYVQYFYTIGKSGSARADVTIQRIPGNENRADGLSRINWDKQEGEAVENMPAVDGFLDQEEDIRLHINEWSPRVPSCVGHPIWHAPNGYEQKAELVLKPFEEEDPWGSKDVQWMMKLALAGTHSLMEEVRIIEEGLDQVEKHEELMRGMYLLVNTLLQGNFDQIGSLNPTENEDVVPESQDDEFEEGEIKEVFHAEEYNGIYRTETSPIVRNAG
ncbi:hypothetical protein CBR_g16906 [Chara braunii]|uniref:Retrotransposon gag domain-containing protein n=1 Tax=Chara braunii TaxID=69332 RepID=A0A388KUE3_CHABU|nr:hypothetical protein CBR_g16906 [Chara braunii]|eukprot:GBG73563.1 hypothetical protein CBR_g16906 [Chara braunii]